MADSKVTALSAIAAIATGDLIYVVDDPAGSPVSTKATVDQLQTFMRATQAQQETGTEAAVFVMPSVQHFHQSACKGWVEFEGITTPTIEVDYNFDSIGSISTGTYEPAIETDMSSASYVSLCGGDAGTVLAPTMLASQQTAAKFRVLSYATSSFTSTDAGKIWCAVFGDI